MISSLANLADRNFILGYLLPVIFAVLAALLALRGVPPFDALWQDIVDVDRFASLTLLVIGIWGGASLLFALNDQVHRIFEGYTWPLDSKTRLETYRRRFTAAREQLENLHDAAQSKDAEVPRYLRAYWRFRQEFPSKIEQVRPTAYGNVIRAFEMYPFEVYGVDTVPVWPRLSAVMPENVKAMIDGAKAELDCFVNSAFLASLVAVLCLARAVYGWADHLVDDAAFSWTLAAAPVFAALIAVLAYRAAIVRARGWGNLVCSAFDLHLPRLAEQLGYRLPRTNDERRRFWGEFNQMFLYNDAVNPTHWPEAGRE